MSNLTEHPDTQEGWPKWNLTWFPNSYRSWNLKGRGAGSRPWQCLFQLALVQHGGETGWPEDEGLGKGGILAVTLSILFSRAGWTSVLAKPPPPYQTTVMTSCAYMSYVSNMKRDTGYEIIEMFTHVQFPFLPTCPSTGRAGPRQHVRRTGTFLIQGPQDPSAPQQPQSFLSMLLMANLSVWVSSVRALLIASWLPSDWEQS